MFCMQPSQSILVRSSHQFALIITVWKLITITQFTSERFNKIHDFHDGAILEELVDYYKMQQQLTLTQGHLSRDDVEFSPKYMILRPPVDDCRPLNAILNEYVIMMKMIVSVFQPFFLSFINTLSILFGPESCRT